MSVLLRIVGYYGMGYNYVAKASTMFCLEATVGLACVLFQWPGFGSRLSDIIWFICVHRHPAICTCIQAHSISPSVLSL